MKKILVSVALMAMLSACGTPYRPTPFDHATSGISTIQVVEDAFPETPAVRKLATNGQNISASTSGLGLAGLVVGVAAASIEAGIAAGQNKKINTALATQKFDGEAIFDEAFEAELKNQSYDVSAAKIKRETNRAMIVATKQTDAKDGTALLDVNGHGYGYQQVGGTKMWRPYVVISVKMYDAKDSTKILLDNHVEYNAVVPGELTVNIPADEAYGFESVEAIEANPVKAAEGLRKALIASAYATAQLLK